MCSEPDGVERFVKQGLELQAAPRIGFAEESDADGAALPGEGTSCGETSAGADRPATARALVTDWGSSSEVRRVDRIRRGQCPAGYLLAGDFRRIANSGAPHSGQ